MNNDSDYLYVSIYANCIVRILSDCNSVSVAAILRAKCKVILSSNNNNFSAIYKLRNICNKNPTFFSILVMSANCTNVVFVRMVCKFTCCSTDRTCSGSLTCSHGPNVLVSNNLVEPTALHLKSGVVLTDNTVNCNFIACNGLVAHCIVSCFTVCAVETINCEFINSTVCNIEITILSIVNVGNNTCYIVLISGISVVCKEICESDSLCKCKSSAISRLNYCAAIAIALEVAVGICMTELFNFIAGVCVITSGACICCITCSFASRSCYRFFVIVTCSENFISGVCIAASASVSGVTICCTSRISYNCSIAVRMTKSSDNAVFNFAAGAAGAVLCTVNGFCGLCICDPFAPCVTKSGNFFLSFKNLIANRAVLTFGKTCFCTIRSNSLVNNLCMTAKLTVFFAAKLTNCLILTSSCATLVLALFFNGAKNELNGVNHCSNAAGNCCESNSLFYGCINCDLIVRTVIGVLCKSIFNAVNLDLGGISFILCNVNDNACYVIGNCKLKCSCSGACTKFDTGVTLSIVRRSVNLIHVSKLKCVSICSIRLGSAKCVTVNMSCIAVSAEVEYNLSNNCAFLVTAILTYAVNVSVICNVACCCTANSTSCRILTCSLSEAMLVSNNLVEPTVLHLSRCAVATNDTVNCDFIACNGLVAHCIVSCFTICAVETVNGVLIGCAVILNVEVTKLSIINLNDSTCDIILLGSIFICAESLSDSHCLFYCENRAAFGKKNFAALVIALEVAVFVLVTERICLVSGVGIIAESTSVSGVSTLCAGRICYNYVVVVLERRNYLCVCIAARASEGLNAIFCASRSGSYLGCVGVGVAESRNCTCFDLAASALAVLRAFCIDSRLNVNDPFAPCVTKSGNNLLSFENFLTNGTVRAFCKTCLCTSGSNCLVNYGSMTCSGDYFLLNLCIASCAVCALGETGFCTSGSFALKHHNVVTERLTVRFAANLAKSLLCTCSCAAYVIEKRTVCVTANLTDSLLCASSITAGMCVLIPFSVNNSVFGYRVCFKIPNLGIFAILIPIVKEIAFLVRIFGLCNKSALLNCLCGDTNALACDKVYRKFLCFNHGWFGSELFKPIANGVAARSESEYHD